MSSRRISETHEWFSRQGDIVTVGITPYAAGEMTDITYVEMKPTGSRIDAGSSLGEIESVKTTSDVFSAVDGEIVAVNDAASADPSLLNSDPYGAGWLVKLRVADASPLDALMDQTTYDRTYPH
jgi:glycine cleavage system H protein